MLLPDILRHWGPWLQGMDPQLLLQLGPMLRQLHLFFGPQAGERPRGLPEADGLGDVQRRGDYQRLLHSEWLLAEELPDEFVRRAGSHEHLFLAPQARPHKTQRLLLVLLDAGPTQLGAARLAHLASWIVLARRARECGADLRWGIVQHAPQLFDDEGMPALQRLLQQRTAEVTTPEHWRDWLHWLQQQSLQAGECWLIGSRLGMGLAGERLGSHRLLIDRALEGNALDVVLQQKGQQRRLQLILPAVELAQRLLAGRFEPAVADIQREGARLALAGAPLLTLSGSHVCAPLLDEPGLLVCQVRRQGRRKARIVRQLWSAAATPLAVLFNHGQVGAVLAREGMLQFWRMADMPAVSRPDSQLFRAPGSTAHMLTAVAIERQKIRRVFLLNHDGVLVSWTSPEAGAPGPMLMENVDQDVLALQALDPHSVVYARRELKDIVVQRAGINGRYGQYRLRSEGSQVLLSDGLWHHRFQALATCISDAGHRARWRAFVSTDGHGDIQAVREWTLAPRARALGLLFDDETREPSLIVLDGERRQLQRLDGDHSRLLWESPEPIQQCSVQPTARMAALMTGQRELVVIQLDSGDCLLRVSGNGRSA